MQAAGTYPPTRVRSSTGQTVAAVAVLVGFLVGLAALCSWAVSVGR